MLTEQQNQALVYLARRNIVNQKPIDFWYLFNKNDTTQYICCICWEVIPTNYISDGYGSYAFSMEEEHGISHLKKHNLLAIS